MANSHPGPMSLLLHSPFAPLETPIMIFFETMDACIFHLVDNQFNLTVRWLKRLRKMWDEYPAQDECEWQALIDRDLNLAESILDDRSHLWFITGMRKRILLYFLLMELRIVMFRLPAPPSSSPPSSAPGSDSLFDTSPLLDTRSQQDVGKLV